MVFDRLYGDVQIAEDGFHDPVHVSGLPQLRHQREFGHREQAPGLDIPNQDGALAAEDLHRLFELRTGDGRKAPFELRRFAGITTGWHRQRFQNLPEIVLPAVIEDRFGHPRQGAVDFGWNRQHPSDVGRQLIGVVQDPPPVMHHFTVIGDNGGDDRLGLIESAPLLAAHGRGDICSFR